MSTIKTRVRNKNDTKAHWDLAEQFKPLKGEIILYTDTRQMKVGDGETLVGALPFYPSGDVTAAGNNTFTGTNTFNSTLTCPGGVMSPIIYPGGENALTVPKKDGTLATIEDLTAQFGALNIQNGSGVKSIQQGADPKYNGVIKAASKNKYLSNENMLEYLKLLFTDFNYELNGNNLFISK